MILVTHKTSLLSLADRIIVMEEGQVVLDGKKEYVIEKLSGKA
jgi:ATP-binding cassette subfamily C protein LapB